MFAGLFAWQAYVSKGVSPNVERHCIGSGQTTVTPDFSQVQTPPIDPRSPARRMLANMNELLGNANFIKQLTPEQIESLAMTRKHFDWDVKREADAEKLKAGGYPTRKIFTRFVASGASPVANPYLRSR